MEIEGEGNSIYELIVRSFSDQLNIDEEERLENWMNADPSNRLEYNDFLEIWKRSSQMTMSSKIDISKSLNQTKLSANIYNRKAKIVFILSQIAAVFITAFLLSVFYNNYLVSKPQIVTESVNYNQVKATYGTQTRIELPDKTIVLLNSGSILRFPNSFIGLKTRYVELIGEAHFTVKKNEEQPFIVAINKIQVKVLGTTFNVNAYPGNASITIALVEGSIQLEQKKENGILEVLKIAKNQVCSYDINKSEFSLKNENNLSKYTAWTEGKIIFFNDNIHTVIEKLENWYNVDITIGDKRIEKYRFTGTFIEEPLEQVLNLLSMTSNMQYKVLPVKKLSDNTYSKRQIIIKSK